MCIRDRGWLDFVVDGNSLVARVNADRAGGYLSGTVAWKVAVKPGVSYITTCLLYTSRCV